MIHWILSTLAHYPKWSLCSSFLQFLCTVVGLSFAPVYINTKQALRLFPAVNSVLHQKLD